jgi:hypothetical protein
MFRWIIDLFNWSNEDTKEVISNNYQIDDNGCIKIEVQKNAWLHGTSRTKDVSIDRSFIISHTENNIVFKSYEYYLNFEPKIIYGIHYDDNNKSIENKENLIRYKKEENHTYEYSKEEKCWKRINTVVVGTEKISEQTPLEIFINQLNCKYKLIETVDEFNDYISSALDCDTWCRKKLYDKMKELGLGDGFINQFADLVGNDLDKYYAMIDLANEVSDKDTLMYLYTYKFRQN